MKKAFLNWSSGKDAALTLFRLQQEGEFSVEKLVTTVNSSIERVSMHGLRKELLLSQTKKMNIPVRLIPLSGEISMERYNEVMRRETLQLLDEGFTHSIFGDIFLEDLREYRENQLEEVGLKAVFPLWKKNTSRLIQEFLALGFKAIIVAVNANVLDKSFCGRILDDGFLADLPEGVDPCGENGEFHTFVFDGPIFIKPVDFEIGEFVQRTFEPKENDNDNCFSDKKASWDTSFWYCDLIPK